MNGLGRNHKFFYCSVLYIMIAFKWSSFSNLYTVFNSKLKIII